MEVICKERDGKCTKGKCQKHEEKIQGGCKGKKCKCCAPIKDCPKAGKACLYQGGVCVNYKDCKRYNNRKGCKKNKSCVCCLDNGEINIPLRGNKEDKIYGIRGFLVLVSMYCRQLDQRPATLRFNKSRYFKAEKAVVLGPRRKLSADID